MERFQRTNLEAQSRTRTSPKLRLVCMIVAAGLIAGMVTVLVVAGIWVLLSGH